MKIAFILIVVHFFADFVFQTDKMAKGKSKNWVDLLSHTATYSFIWFVCIGFIFDIGVYDYKPNLHIPNEVFIFTFITFICHTITDYFTSRLNSKLWEQGRTHDFFVSIGFDQILHYAQLFLTYHFLTK